jgi:hypothetical protein
MTSLLSVKELADNLDDPTDDQSRPDYFGLDWIDNFLRNDHQKIDIFGELPVLQTRYHTLNDS